jgi:DNA polymerase-3 subunit delta'
MSEPLAPWQLRALGRALAAQQDGRLPHALLIAGPERLGKRQLAERLAQALLCERPAADGACGACGSCVEFAARFHRDPPESRPDESPAHPDGHPGHPDARFVGYVLNEKASPKKMYQELVIDQIRELSAWLQLTPSRRNKVVLLEPAHALTHAAANALLKTLEEPIAGRYLILVSDQPHRLPATIRSRCQRLDVALPPRAEALDWLRARGIAEPAAGAALDANAGHPGLALRDIEEDGIALRAAVARELAAIAGGRDAALAVAQRWGDEHLPRRLRFAAEAVRDLMRSTLVGDTVSALAREGVQPSDPRALATWFDAATRAAAQLRGPLRQDLQLAELLGHWRDATATSGVQPPPVRR